METLVTKILDLSSQEANLPVDVVDLGTPDATALPQQDTRAANHTHAEYTNGTSNYYDDTTGYSKVSNMRGLAGHVPRPTEENRRSSACC